MDTADASSAGRGQREGTRKSTRNPGQVTTNFEKELKTPYYSLEQELAKQRKARATAKKGKPASPKKKDSASAVDSGTFTTASQVQIDLWI